MRSVVPDVRDVSVDSVVPKISDVLLNSVALYSHAV